MKKFAAFVLAFAMILCVSACGEKKPEEPKFDPSAKAEGVMTFAQYTEANPGDKVVVEAYVQAHQTWWNNKVCVYAQDPEGAYFIYNMECNEEDAEKLLPGTKIRVEGVKGEWAGEKRIEECTGFTVGEGTWTAQPSDVSELLGTDELMLHQNEFVSFKGMTVERKAVYKWDNSGQQGDDLYFDVSLHGKTYTFMVESYLCSKSTAVYKAAEALNAGDVIDMEGFLYWYDEINPHITSLSAIQ